MPAFGRLPAPDARDTNFPMRALLPRVPSARTYRYWNANGAWFDQGATSSCVGHAWAHWLEDGPTTQAGRFIDPMVLYREAQLVDEWEGEGYEGTSVRAGCKAAQARGFVATYHWANTLDDIIEALLDVGPVVMGTNWHEGMMEADEAGFLQVSGAVVGGHAYKLDGVNLTARIVRGKNSWGRDWANRGFFYLTFEALDDLFSADGECCLAVEIRK